MSNSHPSDAAPAGAGGTVAAWLYRQDFEQARLRLDGDARIAEEHALKLFESSRMLLQRMLDRLGNADVAPRRAAEPARRS